jgi:hypothetical protein
MQDERGELDKELNEMQTQLEDDIDTEIENMKRLNEDKLAVSRETTLKYKGAHILTVLLEALARIFDRVPCGTAWFLLRYASKMLTTPKYPPQGCENLPIPSYPPFPPPFQARTAS